MADLSTYVPQGYTAGRHPSLSEALAARLERLPPRSPPQRLLAVKAAGASQADLDAFLSQDGLWAPRLKAPGVYELNVTPDDIARFADRRDLFAWIDAATRLFGAAAPAAAKTATVEVAASDLPAAEKRLKAAGAAPVKRADGKLQAKVPAGKLGELLQAKGIDAIEVLGAE
jgi:hypothetical protein